MLRDGTLYYYKSEFDTGFGCRGSVSVIKAAIEVSGVADYQLLQNQIQIIFTCALKFHSLTYPTTSLNPVLVQ